MNREADIRLLQKYGMGALENGNRIIGQTLIFFAGRIALNELYNDIMTNTEAEDVKREAQA